MPYVKFYMRIFVSWLLKTNHYEAVARSQNHILKSLNTAQLNTLNLYSNGTFVMFPTQKVQSRYKTLSLSIIDFS